MNTAGEITILIFLFVLLVFNLINIDSFFLIDTSKQKVEIEFFQNKKIAYIIIWQDRNETGDINNQTVVTTINKNVIKIYLEK